MQHGPREHIQIHVIIYITSGKTTIKSKNIDATKYKQVYNALYTYIDASRDVRDNRKIR